MSATTTSPPSIQELERTLEDVASEYEDLKRQHAKNKQRMLEVEKELDEVKARRREIGLLVTQGDEDATRELEELRDRSRSLEEEVEVLEGALASLVELIDDASKKRSEATAALRKARADEVAQQMRATEERAESLMGELSEVFTEHKSMYGRYERIVRSFNEQEANRIAEDAYRYYHDWLKRSQLGRWMR